MPDRLPEQSSGFQYIWEGIIVGNKMVVIVSASIFVLLIILEGASSEWGMSMLSNLLGGLFHFSK